MNIQCHRESVNLDALFGKYFCYRDSNRVPILLQLELYLDANCVPVCGGVDIQSYSCINK